MDYSLHAVIYILLLELQTVEGGIMEHPVACIIVIICFPSIYGTYHLYCHDVVNESDPTDYKTQKLLESPPIFILRLDQFTV